MDICWSQWIQWDFPFWSLLHQKALSSQAAFICCSNQSHRKSTNAYSYLWPRPENSWLLGGDILGWISRNSRYYLGEGEWEWGAFIREYGFRETARLRNWSKTSRTGMQTIVFLLNVFNFLKYRFQGQNYFYLHGFRTCQNAWYRVGS